MDSGTHRPAAAAATARSVNGDYTVSVVLPTYNRSHELPRAIESVLAQTVTELELIVVDDASTDDTQETLDRYRSDPRVIAILADENLGGGGARNLGIAHAQAPLVAFQDSDDYWMPNKLERQLAALDDRPDCGVSYCGSLYYGQHRSYYLPSPNRFTHFDHDMSRQVLVGSPASTQTLVVRRELFDDEVFDPGFKRFQDWDLVIRLAQRTAFAFVEDPLVVINHSEHSISSVSINDAVYRARILEKYADLFESAPRERARHHYVCARVFQRHGERALAARHFRAAATARLASTRGAS